MGGRVMCLLGRRFWSHATNRAGAEFPTKSRATQSRVHLGLTVNSRKVCARTVIELEKRDGIELVYVRLETKDRSRTSNSSMDEPRKQRASDGVASMGDDDVKVGNSIDRVAKNAERRSGGTEDHTREWRLDDLLSFNFSLEATVDGTSSSMEKVEVEPEYAQSASHPAQSAKEGSSSKTDFALIILNQAIDLEVEMFMNLFIHCTFPLLSMLTSSSTGDMRRRWS